MLVALFACDFSYMFPGPKGPTLLASNLQYAKLFGALGVGSLVVGIALVLLISFQRKLITDRPEITPEEPPTPAVPAGVVA